jgi:hypothetical protein
MAERLTGLTDKIPRIAEMLGVALFAGRASGRLGGRFLDGAVGGIVADGLAHSQLPNNQVGGIALGVYMAGIGLMNILPEGGPAVDFSPAAGGSVFAPVPTGERTITTTPKECIESGGVIIQAVVGTPYVVCRLPED